VAGDADGTGTAAAFNAPRGVAVDGAGVVYVSEFAGHRLRAISPDRAVTLLAGGAQSGSANGTPTRARFNNPMGLSVDARGLTLAVADYYNNRVRRLTRSLGGAWTVSTMTSRDDSDQSERPGQSAELWYPTAVAVDRWGRVLVADSYNDRVRVLEAGGDITTLTAGALLGPGGIAVDAKGVVYIADTRHHRICKLTPPSPAPESSPDPVGAATPPPLNHVWTLSVVAGSGATGRVDGAGATARFNEPRGLAVDKAGAIYVADAGNHCIRKIVTGASGLATVSTVAGGSRGYVDGPLTRARFDTPTAVAIDAQGRVYVADTENHAIRRIQ
jgi:sugar lactone lactonase YvrE